MDESDSREFGSVAWQRRRLNRKGGYDRRGELKRFYRFLPRLREHMDRLTGRAPSGTGRALTPLATTVLELDMALADLSPLQRLIWRMCVMGYYTSFVDGDWADEYIGRCTYEEAGRILGMSPAAVGMHITRATSVLMKRIYDPLPEESEVAA
jgi:hypothetical protein